MQTLIDVFNGDADGLCALLQWRRVYPTPPSQPPLLVSGVKRDNALLGRVQAGIGDRILVLDINFENNRADVARLLAAGAEIDYFDHHYPGQRLEHRLLRLTIDESPDVCTSLLVNKALGGAQSVWAITGAFGDNLPQVATALAVEQGYSFVQIAALRQLGELLNYNGYGSRLADLHFDPVALFPILLGHGDPFTFINEAAEFTRLAAGYADDMAAAEAVLALRAEANAAAYLLPDQPWARRVQGVWANALSQQHPEQAQLIMCPDGQGTLTVSVRSARTRPHGAAEFCQRFPGGGGRAAAGGVNLFAVDGVNTLVQAFMESF